jgi:signal transduction histidine kinase
MIELAPKKRSSIILLCSEDGLVEEVLLDNNNILQTIHLPMGIPYLFTQNSADKLGAFWLELKQNKTADDYQLHIASNGVDMLFSFSGFTLNGKILISGSSEVNDSKKILSGIMQIINEMQNEIRLLKKKVIILEKKIQDEDLGANLMDDFTIINNELVNNQRELNRKNAKISKLMSNLEISRNNLEMFAYSVSHDLKEPARMVGSFMHLYSEKYGKNIDSKGKQYIDFALDGSIRIQKMIDNLLVFYRSSTFEAMETVDLNAVMQEVQKLLNLQLTEKNVQLEIGDLPVVKSAYSAMLQVFQNLINNAVKFTPPERQPQIKVNVEKQGKTWLFSIKDNGVGIAKDELKSVFKLFKQTGAFTKNTGSGLGLAIVQRIIENGGGEIWVESEPGIGSIFKFTIPD